MQKIDIDGIIKKLKEADEWKKYYEYLEKNKIFFNNNIDYFIGKEIIEDLVNGEEINLDGVNEKWFLNRYNSGGNDKNIDVIKLVKNKFIEIFISEIKFCPFCGKTPLILFNSNLQKEIGFLEKVQKFIGKYNNTNIEKGRLFDLDHFFPKDKYPYIAINFYNLIPACKGCNYIKNDDNVLDNKKGIFHPYFGYLDNLGNFNLKENFFFKGEHSNFFRLKQIYLNSQDTKNDIWFIRDKIEKIKTNKHGSKILGIKKNFNTRERIDIFFKNYYPENEQDILKYSNGKLKKDLIENLKL